MYSGLSLISISSLYVDPVERRRNVARRALEAVFRAATASCAGGIRLDTNWTWQPAVRFYARIGMWVRMWKHDLVLTWQPELSQYRVEIGKAEARFLIHQAGCWRAVVTAHHLGDWLGWESDDLEGLPREVSHCIPGTFALHLALAGWPLVRSEETWERRWHWEVSLAPGPEGRGSRRVPHAGEPQGQGPRKVSRAWRPGGRGKRGTRPHAFSATNPLLRLTTPLSGRSRAGCRNHRGFRRSGASPSAASRLLKNPRPVGEWGNFSWG
jgi:hypothetical protein